MTTVAVLAEDEDDALSWAVHNHHRLAGAHLVLLWWPEPMKTILRDTDGFDRLIVTAAANTDPRIAAWKAALLSKVRGMGKEPA